MISMPRYEDRPAQPYAFIKYSVTMQEMQKPAERGFPAVLNWLTQHGMSPAGAPFYNYRRIDMASTLDVEAGFPVDRAMEADGEVQFGTLPAGKYAVVTHTGHYDGLYDATAMLIGWAKERGVAWDSHIDESGDHFACRLEIYETDPDEEPDPQRWVTRLAFKMAD